MTIVGYLTLALPLVICVADREVERRVVGRQSRSR